MSFFYDMGLLQVKAECSLNEMVISYEKLPIICIDLTDLGKSKINLDRVLTLEN